MTFNYSIRKATTNNDKIIRSNWIRYSFFFTCFCSLFTIHPPRSICGKNSPTRGNNHLHHRPQGSPIHRPPVAHEPRRHQLWLDRPPGDEESSSLLPTVKQRKIRTWKFGDKHIEMAGNWCVRCVFWRFVGEIHARNTMSWWALGNFATEAVAVVWLDVDSSFPVYFVSRFQGFCCSLGMKDSLPHCSVENWRKIHRLESVCLSKATDSLLPSTKSHLVTKKHIAKPFVPSFAC